ncbi:MAG: helix-turn-helix domain-containing protein [Erythrobacter sp.]|nr:helix-turn-helix domain-containing protein [Erythrobacter sp.]
MIESIDYSVRLIAIGAGLLLLAMLVAGEVRQKILIPICGMIVGVTGYLVNSTPLMAPTGPLDPVVDAISISVPFWLWLFARNLFEREPERRIVLIVALVFIAGWAIANFIAPIWTLGFYILHLAGLGLIVDLVRVALTDRDDDLIEQRRVIRLWLPLLVAAQAGGILSFEIYELISDTEGQSSFAYLINSLLIFMLILFSGLALLRTDPELLVDSEEDATADEQQRIDLSPAETVLHDKLVAAMNEGYYRTPGLTIALLSEHLDTPEHRLRALINRRLGHRNFSAFLNRYRIAEARAKLANRDSVDLPVLTIAMDLGYNSLPTFNRAFKSETGTTPSDYRREAIGGEETPEFPAEPAVQN